MDKRADKIIGIMIIIAYGIIVGYMIFHNLGNGYLIQTDEAYHATNAYEMFKQGEWIVNTYRYEADYFNSKPPLCLDLMILSYKALGVSGFAARFPSALGGMITFIIIALILFFRHKAYSAAFFSALFGACTGLFTFHMYRAAELDSVFNLFFVLAMLSLFLMKEIPFFMYIYGISLGLAFMCKGPHAAIIFFIGLLYIPAVRAAFKSVKRVALSAVLAAIIPICWILIRYRYDGFKLLNALFFGEVVGRVSGAKKFTAEPLFDFLTSNIAIIFAVVLVVLLVTLLVCRVSARDALSILKDFLIDNYLNILWAVIPVLFFSVTGYLKWYTYTSQIAMCILTANLAALLIGKVSKGLIIVKVVITILVIALSLWFIIPCVKDDIELAGTGGHPVDKFTGEMQEFHEKYGDIYSGVKTYLAAKWKHNKKNKDHWEPEYVGPAEMYCDLFPADGTVDDFLNDSDAILILDKDLWDEYSPVLTGHVILQDDSYLIFSTEMY